MLKSNAWFAVASAVIAACFFFVAAYKTWKQEYERRLKAEAALAARLKGHEPK